MKHFPEANVCYSDENENVNNFDILFIETHLNFFLKYFFKNVDILD